jgi:hypothetical protein
VHSGTPRWEQAFSTNVGVTWETNWIMEFTRLDHESQTMRVEVPKGPS